MSSPSTLPRGRAFSSERTFCRFRLLSVREDSRHHVTLFALQKIYSQHFRGFYLVYECPFKSETTYRITKINLVSDFALDVIQDFPSRLTSVSIASGLISPDTAELKWIYVADICFSVLSIHCYLRSHVAGTNMFALFLAHFCNVDDLSIETVLYDIISANRQG